MFDLPHPEGLVVQGPASLLSFFPQCGPAWRLAGALFFGTFRFESLRVSVPSIGFFLCTLSEKEISLGFLLDWLGISGKRWRGVD